MIFSAPASWASGKQALPACSGSRTRSQHRHRSAERAEPTRPARLLLFPASRQEGTARRIGSRQQGPRLLPPLLRVATHSCLATRTSALHLAPGQASHTRRGGTVMFYQHPGEGQGPEASRGRPRAWAFTANWERTATPCHRPPPVLTWSHPGKSLLVETHGLACPWLQHTASTPSEPSR